MEFSFLSQMWLLLANVHIIFCPIQSVFVDGFFDFSCPYICRSTVFVSIFRKGFCRAKDQLFPNRNNIHFVSSNIFLPIVIYIAYAECSSSSVFRNQCRAFAKVDNIQRLKHGCSINKHRRYLGTTCRFFRSFLHFGSVLVYISILSDMRSSSIFLCTRLQ